MYGVDRRFNPAGPRCMHRRLVRRRIQFCSPFRCSEELEGSQYIWLLIQQWLPGITGYGNPLQKTTALFVNDGLNKAQTFHANLIILDIRMPGRSGLEGLPELKEKSFMRSIHNTET